MSDGLAAQLLSFNIPAYMLIDGAVLENVDQYLVSYGLVGRPLFRKRMDRETLLAGPWLISAGTDEHVLQRSILAVRSVGQGVFWLSNEGDDALFHHLRKLNAARMPDGRVLFFRHYDPDVLAAIVPILVETQAAQLFGAATVIAFVGGSADDCHVEKPNGLPDVQSGPITFEDWQIEKLNERQRGLSRKVIAKMLLENLPTQAGNMSADALLDLIARNEKSARQAGFSSEKSIGTWAYLDLLTNGVFPQDENLIQIIKSTRPGTPDKNLEVGLPYIIKGIKHRSEIPGE